MWNIKTNNDNRVMVFNTTLFQLYRSSQFYWWSKPEYTEKTHRPVIDKLYHIILYWVHLTWAGFELASVVIGTDCKIQLPYDHDHDSSQILIISMEFDNVKMWMQIYRFVKALTKVHLNVYKMCFFNTFTCQ